MLRLFINNIEVEFTQQPDILFNYKAEDTSNPTIVKTMFSKTVYVPKTPNNNKIFGHIGILDRLQTSENYSPSAKYEFHLLNNGDLIESGYVKLDKITKDNYELTLFGGLGSFFYALMYNEDGDKRKLSDLTWYTYFSRDNQPDSDDEFGIKVNNQSVFNAFSYQQSGEYNRNWGEGEKEDRFFDIWDWFTFIPAYNGYYNDFDSDKAIMFIGNDKGIGGDSKYRSITEDGKTYTLKNGYARCDLSTELTEWQVRDLRSYQQRPAFRLRRFIEACTYPENNGGYTVNLDPSFFNTENPYYNDTYVALPKLDELVKQNGKGNINIESDLAIGSGSVGITSSSSNSAFLIPSTYTSDYSWVMDGLTWTKKYYDQKEEEHSLPYSAEWSVQYRFKLNIGVNQEKEIRFGRWNFSGKWQTSSLAVQLIAYSGDNKLLAYSPIYNFTDRQFPLTVNEWKYGDKGLFMGETVNDIKGSFKNGVFLDTFADNNSVFELKIDAVPIVDSGIKIKIVMAKGSNVKELQNGNILINEQPGWGSIDRHLINVGTLSLNKEKSYSICNFGVYDNLNKISLNKKLIFSQEISPAEYLLSFCKMFGLKFILDSSKKEVSILTKNNYYKDNIVNIEDKVDLSADFDIKPLTYDYRYFNMQLETPETDYAEKYKMKYEVDYGMKKINTNYNFSPDEQELFSDNVYKNGITVLDSNPAYYNWRQGNVYYPTINTNMYEYVLFHTPKNSTDLEEHKMYVYPYTSADRRSEYSFNGVNNDAFPKICYFEEDYSLVDFANNLVIRNGIKSISDGEGKWVWYSISDDVEEMYLLNGGKPCYFLTNQPDVYNENIQYTYSLPVYTKYKTSIIKRFETLNDDDEYLAEVPNITDSLDFGSPREMYCNWKSQDETTIYNRFWKKFIEDQYSVDSRVVSCDVLLEGKIDEESLRSFYYFGNSLWVLNAINNYNPAAKYTTNCEFIKVIDKDNYLSGQMVFNVKPYFRVLSNIDNIPFDTTYTIKTQSYSSFKMYVDSPDSQDIEYFTTINGQSLGQNSVVSVVKDGDINIRISSEILQAYAENTITFEVILDEDTDQYFSFTIGIKVPEAVVFNSSKELWDENYDYIQLESPGDYKYIYVSSDGVQWRDRDNLLQDVYVNQDLGSGEIEAGTMVPVKIETKYDIKNNQEGNIVINKGMPTETNVFVEVMLTSPITIFHQNGNIFDKTQGVYLFPGDERTIYFTSSVDVELEYHNGQTFKSNVFTYVRNSKKDMYGKVESVSKGAMIPIKFEYDRGSAFDQRTTDDLVFKANGVQILSLTVVANP